MNRRLKDLANAMNSMLDPLGIRIVRTRSHWQLDLYPEQDRPHQPRYVNIGAGAFFHPFWHNLDMPNEFYSRVQRHRIHLEHDLNSGDPLPFLDNTLKAVYTSHVIEHLPDESVQHCFTNVYRCLQQGGFFRVSCPDIDLEYDAYCRRDLTFMKPLWVRPGSWGTNSTSIEQLFLEHFATVSTLNHPDATSRKYSDEEIRGIFARLPLAEALDYLIGQIPYETRRAYPENHINWFNVKKLRRLLHVAGFEHVYESRYGQSKFPPMRDTKLFDSTMPGVSLYVECQK